MEISHARTWKVDLRPDEEDAVKLGALRRCLEEANDELQYMKAQLLESERLAVLGRMAYSISHDLRHHLAAVYSNVEFMGEPNNPQSDQEDLQHDVLGAIHDMTDLLDSLLLAARTGQTINDRPGSLNHLIEDTVKMLRPHPHARNVQIVTDNLPLVEIQMDSHKLGSVIYNLLLNACHAANRGLLPGRVGISLCQDRDSIRLRVQDSRPGITDYIRESLFEPFVTGQKMNGLGLGLAIADRYAKEHGGSVYLEQSRPGHTVFSLHLSKLAIEKLFPVERLRDTFMKV